MNRANGIGPSRRISSRIARDEVRVAPGERPESAGTSRRSSAPDAVLGPSLIGAGRGPAGRPGPTRVWPPSTTGIGRVAAGLVSVAQPRVADPFGKQQVGREAVLGRGPAGLSAPRRWASRTRLSTRAASPRRARCCRAPRARRVEEQAEHRRGRRWPSTRRRCRSPRSSTRARVRDAVALRARRASPREARPATTSSACESETVARTPATPARPLAYPPAATSSRPTAEQDESSGESMSTPSRHRPRRSSTSTPATSRASAAGRCRPAGPEGRRGRPGAADRDDVGRVAVVGERRGRRADGRDHEIAAVARVCQRNRTRAEDDEAAADRSRRPARAAARRRTVVRPPVTIRTSRRPGPTERRRVPFAFIARPAAPASVGDPPGPGGAGFDVDLAGRRRARSSTDEVTRGCPTVRAYIGLGANVGDAAGRSPRPSMRWPPCPVRASAASRGCTRPRRRRHRPARFPQRGRRPRRAGRPRSGRGGADLLVALKRLEREFGPSRRAAGDRASSTSTCSSSVGAARNRAAAGGAPLAADIDPARRPSAWRSPTAISDRLFVLAPLADLRPGSSRRAGT